MSVWRHVTRGARALIHRRETDRDIIDEAQHYFDEAVAALMACGYTREDADRTARIEIGSLTRIREQARSYGWEHTVETVLSDVRFAARGLRKNPGFTVVAALTLALGIGATTAIFSVLNPILFQPLPYPRAERLVIWDIFEGARADTTFHTYQEIAARSRSFEWLATVDGLPWQPTIAGASRPARLDGQSVTADYFRVLAVGPSLGRNFTVEDDRFRGPKVVIISDGLWRRRFAGDRGIIGRKIRLDDDLYTVIGVMPRRFDNVLGPATEIWKPQQYETGHIADFDSEEWGHHMHMAGRLRAGVSVAQAKQELADIARTRIAEFPRPRFASLTSGFIVDSLKDQVTRGVKPALVAVAGAVVLVLIIACVNVMNLVLARGAGRRGEFAMRAALGAGRTRLTRQMVTESLLLAITGGVLGVFIAKVGISTLIALSPAGLPRLGDIELSGTVFAFASVVTGAIGVITGLIPSIELSRRDPLSGIQQSSKRIAGTHHAAPQMLVISEVALALVLLVGAGLLLRSLERLFAVAPGFDPSHLLTLQVQISGHRYDSDATRWRFYARALEAVRRVPSVASAAETSLLPFSGDQYGAYGVQFEEDRRGYDVSRYAVSSGYFETMGIPVRRGRPLRDYDTVGAQQVAVISESLARRQFPHGDAVGKRLHLGPIDRPWCVIVGVVSDVKQGSLADNQTDAVYIPSARSWFADDAMSIVARVRGDATAARGDIEKAIWSVDKDEAIVNAATMDNLLRESGAERRFAMIVFEAFAAAALLLAAIGVYGVLAGAVAERTREIGVRAALGASKRAIVGNVIEQGAKLVALGGAIGIVVAVAASKALTTLLFGVSRLDPLTYAAVAALLGAVAVVACSVPAWRAARVDPVIALRTE